MPTSPADFAARATTFQIAAGTSVRGPSQASLRRSTVNPTDLPSGPLAENLTSCASQGRSRAEANSGVEEHRRQIVRLYAP